RPIARDGSALLYAPYIGGADVTQSVVRRTTASREILAQPGVPRAQVWAHDNFHALTHDAGLFCPTHGCVVIGSCALQADAV
ncbi:MAG TPA: hypothetical protein VNN80_07700, partial [Polyangiaceae bacterium]|nr:hypothetical protein [Polyangiaceae bacterium]